VTRRRQQEPPPPQPPAAGAPVDRWQTILGGLLAAGMFLACCFPLADTDLWWHLKTGEIILDTGQIPYIDLYTFTDADKPWIDLHWGFQVLMAAAHRIGGAPLLVVLKATVLTAAFVIGWLACGRELPAWLRALPWLLALVTISGRGYERPEMFTLLFLAAWLWLMERIDAQPRWLWWLPVLQVVWINLHALFVLGLVVGACQLAHGLLRRMADGRWGLVAASDCHDPRRVAYVTALCAFAALVNPYFEEGALFPLTLYRKFNVEQEFYAQHIGEFQRPYDFWKQFGWQNLFLNAEIALWCVAALSFAPLACRGRWSAYRLLLFAGFSHLAWEASRNTNIFSLVAAVVACGNFNELWLMPTKTENRPWSYAGMNWSMAAILAAFLVAVPTGIWHRVTREEKTFGFGERAAWFPHDAAKFAGQPAFPDHAFASHFGVASVYTYHNGPNRKVFMDGRLEVCTQRTFEQYNAILAQMAQGRAEWEALLRDDQGRLPVVLLDSRHSRAAINGLLQQPHWRLVFADPSCAVFLETAQAERLGLSAADFRPLVQPPGVKLKAGPP
jgi:hypothetical protein